MAKTEKNLVSESNVFNLNLVETLTVEISQDRDRIVLRRPGETFRLVYTRYVSDWEILIKVAAQHEGMDGSWGEGVMVAYGVTATGREGDEVRRFWTAAEDKHYQVTNECHNLSRQEAMDRITMYVKRS